VSLITRETVEMETPRELGDVGDRNSFLHTFIV
jgi:hypothetical protein